MLSNLLYNVAVLNYTERHILYLLYKKKQISRKDIAARLKITSSSVSQNINNLIAKNMIREIGAVPTNSVGRNKVLLGINYNLGYVLGFAIELDCIDCALANCSGEYIASYKVHITIDAMFAYLQNNLEHIFKKLLDEAQVKLFQLIGIGITYVGKHKKTGEMDSVSAFIEAYFTEEYNLIVTKGNNVHGLAIAEYMLNEFDDNFFCIKYGPKVGSAFWLRGKLYKGHHNLAGEMGHMLLPVSRARKVACKHCGKVGCLDSLVSEAALISEIKKYPNYRIEFPYLFDADGTTVTPKLHDIMFHANKHEFLSTLMHESAKNLAYAISVIEDVIDTKKIILYGESFLAKDFFDLVHHHIINYCNNTTDIEIVTANTSPANKATGALFLLLTQQIYV